MSDTNSLERMLSILSVFSDDKYEWTPDELIDFLGYTRPTLYRYLKILTDAGLVTSLPPGRYLLGPRVVELHHLVRMSDPLILAGTTVASELAAQFKGTAMLIRWYRNRMVCIHHETTPQAPIVRYMRGQPMGMSHGATARAIIAALPRRKALPLVESLLNDFRASGFGETTEAVLTNLRKIKRQGFAHSRGEVMAGVNGTSAPIIDGSRMPIGALCLTQHDTAHNASGAQTVAQAVVQGAATISDKLANPA
ncbi:IclR family transcriptional regulator [Pararhodobacter zhoushanensis]|uniref:Helix-turn-helix domain-containing protein n=1 Tax=Pararhodobacter zhoushanensis TaxID=2479545 RepID=A0ABT3GWE1_9RHOB|nr:IclR family transcriptional regulator C-terminal domain-containing protein [Pararhodobacter zhoushanensis]MCW1931831.1 helix-turn-helix domain-containing protein [Pararhodobacter zhoushanensis]